MTSVIPVEQNGKKTHVPVITVLESGTAVHVRPISTKSGHVHLDAKLVFSHIGDVEELTFDAVSERDEHGNMVAEGTTLQVPEFTATKVAISTAIPLNGAYVVAGMESPDTDDDRRAVVVFRVRPGAEMNAIERSAEANSEKKTR